MNFDFEQKRKNVVNCVIKTQFTTFLDKFADVSSKFALMDTFVRSFTGLFLMTLA